MLTVPHRHQANILRHPQNDIFIFLQLLMEIQLIAFRFGEQFIS